MTTFSQLVDDIVRETRRPDLLADIADYLNQTIRETHFTPDKGNVITFRENFRETQLTANSETSFGWEIPNPANFQQMQVVRYDSLFSRGGAPVYAVEKVPSRLPGRSVYTYYRSGQTYYFSEYGGTNSIISLGWYEYPRRLKYRDALTRQASYDIELGWDYHEDWNTAELQLDARNLNSNWLLLRWRDFLAEGVKAKVYKRLSDDGRARTAYSLYTQMRQGLYTSEISSGGNLS